MHRRLIVVAIALACLLSTLPGRSSHAATGSLPTVRSGARPGPAVLYAGRPQAPLLENRDARFRAAPLLVSGAEAYVNGEYLYQDYLYDDGGARVSQRSPTGEDIAGGLDYPSNVNRYLNNSADLVEFRIAPSRNEVAYRITLNTLVHRDSTIVAIAFDTDRNVRTGIATLPGDPLAPFPGTDEVITAWGTGATYSRASKNAWRSRRVNIKTDLEANQMTIVVPRSVSDPRGTWRTSVATGVHDRADHSWRKPRMGASTKDTPSASQSDLPAVFNLAFRFHEPIHDASRAPDNDQADALAAREPTRFARNIDFRTLERKADRSNARRTGTIVRIFPSRVREEGGKDFAQTPNIRSQLQQYSVYVPKTYRRDRPAGLTLMLHSLGQHHWQYNGSTGVQLVGEQRANFVLTPHARGADGWYQQEAEYDVFEAWNDLARHYSLDPNRTAVSGYSMGGYGTYRLGSLWPDLFGRAFSTVGPPADGLWIPPRPATGGQHTNTNVWLENTRNVPYLNVVGLLDELVPYAGTRAQNMGAPELGIRGFEQLGYRYRFVTYPTGEHYTVAAFSYDTPYALDFLGTADVDRNPDHVTFSYAPATDSREHGLVHDHAYWVSGVRLAARSGAEVPKGTVDAFSHARGRGRPATTEIATAGVGPLPYVEVGQDWAAAPRIPRENKLTLRLTNVRDVRLDVVRAGIDPHRTLVVDLHTTTAATIRLMGADKDWVVKAPAGRRTLQLR